VTINDTRIKDIGYIFAMKTFSNHLQSHAYHLLQKSQDQAKKLSDHKNPEALHDFRVSIRHLRSFLKSYQDVLGKDGKKAREQLGQLMQTTSAGRDNEVHIDWLTQQQKKASAELKPGIDILLKTFSEHPPLNVKKIQKQYVKHSKKLETLFKKIRFKESFNSYTSQVLSDYAQTLKDELSQLSKDAALLHQTRITGKRLRYTLELVESKENTNLIIQLKSLQDLLGNINDLELLLQKLENFLHAEIVHWSHTFLARKGHPSFESIVALVALQKHLIETL
jgi:CHAD domain-containing protein